MLRRVQQAGQWLFLRVEALFNLAFGDRLNPLYYLGVSSNIMSLGGLALAIGVLVDASFVMVENAYRRVSEGDVPYADQPRAIVAA